MRNRIKLVFGAAVVLAALLSLSGGIRAASSTAGSTNVQGGGAFDPTRDLGISGNIDTTQSISATKSITSYGGPTVGGIGYSTGAGASVTQATNRTTGVTINALCGSITTNNASLAAEASAAFVVTNSAVAIGDVVVISQRSGAVGVMTDVAVSATAAGSFTINVMNNNVAAGTAETGSIVINFAVVKAVTS